VKIGRRLYVAVLCSGHCQTSLLPRRDIFFSLTDSQQTNFTKNQLVDHDIFRLFPQPSLSPAQLLVNLFGYVGAFSLATLPFN
jgi:hypothetical protein